MVCDVNIDELCTHISGRTIMYLYVFLAQLHVYVCREASKNMMTNENSITLINSSNTCNPFLSLIRNEKPDSPRAYVECWLLLAMVINFIRHNIF